MFCLLDFPREGSAGGRSVPSKEAFTAGMPQWIIVSGFKSTMSDKSSWDTLQEKHFIHLLSFQVHLKILTPPLPNQCCTASKLFTRGVPRKTPFWGGSYFWVHWRVMVFTYRKMPLEVKVCQHFLTHFRCYFALTFRIFMPGFVELLLTIFMCPYTRLNL